MMNFQKKRVLQLVCFYTINIISITCFFEEVPFAQDSNLVQEEISLECIVKKRAFVDQRRRPENESLLETIKIEAGNMEVFPVDMIADSAEGAIYQKPYVELQKRKKTKVYIHKWGERYELTFERYLPFYRFKTRVGLATMGEIDECVDAFDQLTAKEKALAITAIFIFERIRRRPTNDEDRLIPNGSLKNRFPYYPFYPIDLSYYDYVALLLPKYSPTNSIPSQKWDKWIETIEKCLASDEIAFPEIESPVAPKRARAAKSNRETLDSMWAQNLDRCRDLIRKKLDVSLPRFGEDARSLTMSKEFLQRAYEFELDPAVSKYSEELALRDYWFTVQNDNYYLAPLRGLPKLRNGNSSLFPKTLGDIADQLLKSRLEYEPSEPIQTP